MSRVVYDSVVYDCVLLLLLVYFFPFCGVVDAQGDDDVGSRARRGRKNAFLIAQ